MATHAAELRYIDTVSAYVDPTPSAAVISACSVLRANLQTNPQDTPRSLGIVGCTRAHSYADVVLGLAFATLAAVPGRVLVVDADLNRPTLHGLFKGGLPVPGFTDFAASSLGVSDAIRSVTPRLDVITSGSETADPAGVMLNPDLIAAIAGVERDYIQTLFLTPPLDEGPAGALLAARLDGAVLVVRAGGDEPNQLVEAREMLSRTGARLRGFVLVTG